MKKSYHSPLSEEILLEPQGALLGASNESYGINDDPLFTSDPS